MNLDHLLQHLTPYQLKNIDREALQELEITSIEMDSRKVIAGSLFVCLVGYQTDGHQYVQQALDRGAVAVVAEKPLSDCTAPMIMVPDTRRVLAFLANRFYDHPTHKLRLIGVTGTNGKTTVTHLIEKMLEDQGKKTGRIGTMNMKIDDELFEVQNTTPESIELQKAFAKMVEKRSEYAVIEASSHAIHMGRIRGSHFRVAVFTNLTQDHLDYHGTMDEYKRAKGLLFAQLGNSYREENLNFAILNGDDEAHIYYQQVTPAQVLTYGIDNPDVDVRATDIQIDGQGTAFTVECFKGTEKFHLQMLGKFNVYNALATISVGLVEGLSLEGIKKSIEGMKGVRGRMEPVHVGQNFSVVVDYAHTPDSLENVLKTCQEFVHNGKIYCVVGCGGNRDRSKRPIMANIAVQYADKAVFTSDNPRSEDPNEILEEMIRGVKDQGIEDGKYVSMVDRKEAIEWAIRQAQKNDIVLIAGKGHETYQEINGKKYPFDDREWAIEFLQQKK